MVNGAIEPGFEPVRDAFERCFAELGETGASFAAIAGGRVVADLWGGDGFERDSLVHVYSVTKAMSAFCVLMLVDRGLISSTSASPATGPSSPLPARRRSRSGSCCRTRPASSRCGSRCRPRRSTTGIASSRLLAAEAPWWEPGTAHGEHALFYGHLCGELVRRVDGRSLGAFWRDEVARPWSLDFHIGLMPHEQPRAVDLTGAIVRGEAGAMYRQALDNPPGLTELDVVNSVAWRAAEIPAVNGHGTAMSIARFYAGLLGGGSLEGRRLVSETTVAAMRVGEMSGRDLVMDDDFTWGLGVAIEPDGFGMGGIGGSLGWADPDLGGFAYGYATRAMADHDRALAVDAALRDVLRRR